MRAGGAASDDAWASCDLAGPTAIKPATRPPADGGDLRVRTEEEILMATARLRVFPHPPDEPTQEFHAPSVPIRLSDLYPLLAQAHRDNFVWLRDFENDEIMVSSDLHEVVRAFSDMRPSA